MVFAPTPPRNTAPSQLLSLTDILASTGGSQGTAKSGSVTITNPPVIGAVGSALAVAGTVTPGGSPVQVGLSSSTSVAPKAWVNAAVSGGNWTASLTPSTAGTSYIWAEAINTPSVKALSAALAIVGSGSSSITLSSPPAGAVAGTAMSISGTVAPSGSAVQVGLSTSSTTGPTAWTSATVNGTGWTASVTPSTAGSYYVWAEQTGATSVQTVSGAVSVAAAPSGGSALSYSLISGSGNGSLSGITLTTGTSNVSDWTSSIVHGSTDVRPGVTPSAMGAIAACKFWFDSSSTSVTVPSSNYGNAGSLNNSQINFYANNTGYGTPTACPAAPSTAGTYFGKYAMYDSGSNLLGIFVTSAISIT